jgi:hypothetical protein
MGLSPVSSVRSRLDYKIKVLLGSSTFCHMKERSIFYAWAACCIVIFFAGGAYSQPCLEYLDRVRMGGGPNSVCVEASFLAYGSGFYLHKNTIEADTACF